MASIDISDPNFGTEPFPENKMTSEEIIATVEDILARPVSAREAYVLQNHRNFMLLYPRLFRSVTGGDSFDVRYLKRMLALIDDSNTTVEKATQVIGQELHRKYVDPIMQKGGGAS